MNTAIKSAIYFTVCCTPYPNMSVCVQIFNNNNNNNYNANKL